MIIKVNPVA